MQKRLKTHVQHGITQFELTTEFVKNLSQFEVTPAAKLVLLYLSTCYNPKKADVFPKQKTIAAKLGISERSVVRAVQELIKAGIIIAECNHSNRYRIISKWTSQSAENEKIFTLDNLSDSTGQNDNKICDKLTPHEHKQTKEPYNQPINVEDFKILKDYAIQKGARNINAYVNALIKAKQADKIILDIKRAENNARAMQNLTSNVLEDAKFARENRAEYIPQCWFEMKKKILSQ